MPSIKRESATTNGGGGGKKQKVARSGDKAKVKSFLEKVGEKGASQDQIQDGMEIETEALQNCIQDLLADKSIELFRDPGNNLVFKLVEANGAFTNKEEEFVYQCIARAGDRGLWTKDIKIQSGLPANTLTKIYKTLEGRMAIKTVKSITSKSKKMYMLYDLEPAKELTGGPWYTDQDFDHQFIDELRTYCLTRIDNSESQSVAEITTQLELDAISKVKLTKTDVKQLLRTLELDGQVEAFSEGGENRYRTMKPNSDKEKSNANSTRFQFQHWQMLAEDFAWRSLKLGDFEAMSAHEPHHHAH
mmetsp:Transcript_21007/g.43823  ORF Transcript_21007/g.43823 Transcript_21007/m.43823 type:complete len:303 (-) Transcript_21007:44-952(-)